MVWNSISWCCFEVAYLRRNRKWQNHTHIYEYKREDGNKIKVLKNEWFLIIGMDTLSLRFLIIQISISLVCNLYIIYANIKVSLMKMLPANLFLFLKCGCSDQFSHTLTNLADLKLTII